MPPWNEVADLGLKLLGPALAASFVVMLVASRLLGVRVATALAILAGVLAGSMMREVIPWRLDAEKPLVWHDWLQALEASLEMPTSEDENAVRPPPSYYWLPWLVLLAMITDLLGYGGAGWAARAGVALFAGRLLTPLVLRAEFPWAPWCLGVVILLHWGVLSTLARTWNNALIPVVTSTCLFAAAAVILHAHSARLTDAALVFGMAILGTALVAFRRPGNVSACAAAAAVALPGLLLVAHQETFSEVPLRSFALAALAPLTLVMALLPLLNRLDGWKRWGFALLPAVPATLAVLLAAQAESLPF